MSCGKQLFGIVATRMNTLPHWVDSTVCLPHPPLTAAPPPTPTPLWQDFANHTAFHLLDTYRSQLCCFNDDVQVGQWWFLGGGAGTQRYIQVTRAVPLGDCAGAAWYRQRYCQPCGAWPWVPAHPCCPAGHRLRVPGWRAVCAACHRGLPGRSAHPVPRRWRGGHRWAASLAAAAACLQRPTQVPQAALLLLLLLQCSESCFVVSAPFVPRLRSSPVPVTVPCKAVRRCHTCRHRRADSHLLGAAARHDAAAGQARLPVHGLQGTGVLGPHRPAAPQAALCPRCAALQDPAGGHSAGGMCRMSLALLPGV